MVDQFSFEDIKSYIIIEPEIIQESISAQLMKEYKLNKNRKDLVYRLLKVLDEKIHEKHLNEQNEMQKNYIENQQKYDKKYLKYQIQLKYKEIYGELNKLEHENKQQVLKEWETFKLEVDSYQSSYNYQLILNAIHKFELRYGKITQLTKENRELSMNLHRLITQLNEQMRKRQINTI